jgi:hypothetical protein
LKTALPKIQIGAGSNYNFNEINKNRFQPEALDFVSFSMDPQEHASDDLTILENTEAQRNIWLEAPKLSMEPACRFTFHPLR